MRLHRRIELCPLAKLTTNRTIVGLYFVHRYIRNGSCLYGSPLKSDECFLPECSELSFPRSSVFLHAALSIPPPVLPFGRHVATCVLRRPIDVRVPPDKVIRKVVFQKSHPSKLYGYGMGWNSSLSLTSMPVDGLSIARTVGIEIGEHAGAMVFSHTAVIGLGSCTTSKKDHIDWLLISLSS